MVKNSRTPTDRSKNKQSSLFKKRSMNRTIRIILMLIFIILILASATGASLLFLMPKSETQQVELFNYKQDAMAGYTVHIKENEIYGAGSLGEGKVYLSELVTGIDTKLNYAFKGASEADLEGTYEVVAIMEGSQRVDRNDIIIWTKQYVLVPKTKFSASDGQFQLSPALNIDFINYRDFVATLSESLDFRFNSNLTVRMNVDITATTEEGVIKEKASPSISFPLNKDYFEINKAGEMAGKEGAIHKTIMLELPMNSQLLILYLLIIALSIFALSYLRFYTYGRSTDSLASQQMKDILKKYNNRMVSLADKDPFASNAHYKVDSLQDLIVLSDETGNPVFFHGSKDAEAVTWFCVLVGEDCFIWHTGWDKPAKPADNEA